MVTGNTILPETDTQRLVTYGVFERPLDAPDKYVVRAFITLDKVSDTNAVTPGPAYYADTLEEARNTLPPSACMRIARMPEDPPFLIETWL